MWRKHMSRVGHRRLWTDGGQSVLSLADPESFFFCKEWIIQGCYARACSERNWGLKMNWMWAIGDINHLTSAWRKQWNYFDNLALGIFFFPKRLWLLIRMTYSAEMLFHSQSRCVLRNLIRYQVTTGPVSPIPKLTCIPFYCQTYDHRGFCGFSLELFCWNLGQNLDKVDWWLQNILISC